MKRREKKQPWKGEKNSDQRNNNLWLKVMKREKTRGEKRTNTGGEKKNKNQ